MDQEKLLDLTEKTDIMLHRLATMNELLKRSGKLSAKDHKAALTDIKSIIELGETLELAMELMPPQNIREDQRKLLSQLLKGLRQFEDMDIEKMLQLAALLSSMNNE